MSKNTIKKYSSILVDWFNYCKSENVCHFNAPKVKIIEYLTKKYNNGAKYGSLNSARAAIAKILDYSIANDQLIINYFKSIYRSRPSRAKYDRTWDVNVVLKNLSTWYPLEELSQKITKTLATLLALVTAHRVQTIASIETQNIIHRQGQIEIEIPNIIKTSAPGKAQPLLLLPYFNQKLELCVASTCKFS